MVSIAVTGWEHVKTDFLLQFCQHLWFASVWVLAIDLGASGSCKELRPLEGSRFDAGSDSKVPKSTNDCVTPHASPTASPMLLENLSLSQNSLSGQNLYTSFQRT